MHQTSLTPKELAIRWYIKETTLSQWRWKRKGPLFTKENNKVSYSLQDIEWFEEQHRRQMTGSVPEEAF